MSLLEASPLPIVDAIDTLPSEVQDLIERHVGAFPTRESIEKICKDRLIGSYKEQVLRFFLMESPLNLDDLRPLTKAIGFARAARICQGVAKLRKHREMHDWTPRWSITPEARTDKHS